MDEQNTMNDFMDEIEKSMKRIYKGDVLKGKIISINDEQIMVNIGYISDGIILKEEMDDQYPYQIGEEISVYVVNPHDEDGNIVLSHKKAEQIVGWDEIEEAFDVQKKIKVKVTEVIKGGVSTDYRNVRCFIPASLLSYRFVEDMTSYIGQELEVVVEDFDREKKRVVLSRKAIEVAEREAKKKNLMERLQAGQMCNGIVTKLMKYGVFVDIGGAEGLIHLNDLAWHRVNDPSQVVAEGDQVEVYVSNIDRKTGKIALVLKKVEEDPWKGIADYYRAGDLVEGVVVRLTDFGAFVEIEEGVEGLVHISEIASNRIHKPSDVLSVGDQVNAIILNIDENAKKLSLSIKEAEGQMTEDIEIIEEEQGATLGDLFGDKLKDFFK